MHAVLERPLRRRGCKRNIGPAQLGARASNKCSEGDGPRPGRDRGAGAMPAAHHVPLPPARASRLAAFRRRSRLQ